MPFWIYFIVGGILLSAIMAVRAARLEREQIEAEGEVYMERLQAEKEQNLTSMQ